MVYLPTEVLIDILACVRATSPFLNLYHCILTCRRWHEIGLSLLYEHLCITNRNLKPLIDCLSRANVRKIHSLTCRIDWTAPLPQVADASSSTKQTPTYLVGETKGKPETHEPRQHNPDSLCKGICDEDPPTLLGSFEQLATRLPEFSGLESFSFFDDPWRSKSTSSGGTSIQLAHSAFVSILNGLPESCTALEVQLSKGRGRGNSPDPEFHLCTLIARHLPHLRFLRLHLGVICPKIFGEAGYGVETIQYTPCTRSKSRTVARADATKLEALSIDCRDTGFCDPLVQINAFHWAPHILAYATHAQISQGAMPNIQTAQVLTTLLAPHAQDKNQRELRYDRYLRFDCITRSTVSIPYGEKKDNRRFAFIRTPEYGEAVRENVTGLNYIAEDSPWETLWGPPGVRLPITVIARDGHAITKPIGCWTRKSFETARPGKTCPLWINEDRCGTRLLSHVIDPGFESWPNRHLRQIVPPGWKVVLGGYLQPDGLSPIT